MDINGVEKSITLEGKSYTSEELLNAINHKFSEESIDVEASYFEGKLKFSFKEVGANTIDGIRGNASGSLFFNIDSRESDLPEYYQIGANTGDHLKFEKPRISTELMRINTITIHKTSFATKALGRLDGAINYNSKVRSRIGATQNRLEYIINNNDNATENLQAAESRIRDLDMAKEMMELTRSKILDQVMQTMMAQANHNPEKVLQLI